jgi:outer membrane biosynthesis protein TonB
MIDVIPVGQETPEVTEEKEEPEEQKEEQKEEPEQEEEQKEEEEKPKPKRKSRAKPPEEKKTIGRPPGARNKPKPPEVIERVIERVVDTRGEDITALLAQWHETKAMTAQEKRRQEYAALVQGMYKRRDGDLLG